MSEDTPRLYVDMPRLLLPTLILRLVFALNVSHGKNHHLVSHNKLWACLIIIVIMLVYELLRKPRCLFFFLSQFFRELSQANLHWTHAAVILRTADSHERHLLAIALQKKLQCLVSDASEIWTKNNRTLGLQRNFALGAILNRQAMNYFCRNLSRTLLFTHHRSRGKLHVCF